MSFQSFFLHEAVGPKGAISFIDSAGLKAEHGISPDYA